MDDVERAAWRERLKKSYGSWLCHVCKCSYASQAQFEQMAGVELVRHSECGHVIMWRAGGADFLAPYLEQRRLGSLSYSIEWPDLTPRFASIPLQTKRQRGLPPPR